MPQAKDDPRGRERFEFGGAGVNLQEDRSKVRMPFLVESVGTDGRFVGAIRPFPGFADDSLHGIPVWTGSNPTTLTNVRLAKYVSIRKGLGNGVLRGIVFLADNYQDHDLVGASTDYRWQASQVASHTNSYYLRHRYAGLSGYVDAHLPLPSDLTLVIDGVNTARTSGFNSATPLTAGQWGIATTSGFSNDLGSGELDNSHAGAIYYRHDAGGTDPDTLADGYIKARLTGWGVYFCYWDSDAGTSGCVQLDDLRMLEGDPLGTTLSDYDFACNDRYIYLVTGERASRAYWYDFQHNSWQASTNTFASRYMGIYSPVELSKFQGLQVNGGIVQFEPDDSENNDFPYVPAGTYWGGIELMSRKHGLRTFMGVDRAVFADAGSGMSVEHFHFVAAGIGMPIYNNTSDYIDGRWLSPSVTYWGLSQWDAIRVWRRLKEDTANVLGSDLPFYGRYFMEAEVNNSNNPWTDANAEAVLGSSISYQEPLAFTSNMTFAAWNMYVWSSDTALAQGTNAYDPFVHEVGRVPESKRIECLDGMTVVIAKPRVFVNAEVDWFYDGQLSETIMYSSLVMGEKENFPITNVWRPSTPGETYHALLKAGDYVVAIGSAGVYRLLQNGTEMSGTTLVRGTGGVSRWGQTSVGASVFMVSPSGFKEIDTNTGSIRNLAALDRMIFDDRQWGSSLASIHVAYDATAGALILLNTVEDECIILWEATGAITTLEDCPWSFLTQGPDAKTGGNQRAYFVTDAGVVHCIDALRTMPVKSMCGAGGGTDDILVNGTVAASSTTTVINVTADGANDIPDDCLGFKVYFRSGENEGLSRTISVRNGDLQFTVSEALPSPPSAGDSISIAPIRFRVTCPQIQGGEGHDGFEYKRLQTVGAAFTEIEGGEGAGTFQVGAYKRTTKLAGLDIGYNEIPDQCLAYVNAAGTQLYPYIESTMADLDFELQALLTRSSLTGSEAESRQGS